jgi:tetratricopeptide (TPR) repeat protein
VKQFPNSLAAAERLVALAPDSFGSYELRARAFYHLSNYAACIQDCDRSIQLKPDHAIAWAMRGEAKVAIGDKPGGKRDLDHAVALAGGDEFYKSIRTAALA